MSSSIDNRGNIYGSSQSSADIVDVKTVVAVIVCDGVSMINGLCSQLLEKNSILMKGIISRALDLLLLLCFGADIPD